MKIGQILQEQQPDVHEKLNKNKPNKKKQKPKERKPRKEHLSFNGWDRIMRERSDVDETKCRGR
jgi:hypothetical protein